MDEESQIASGLSLTYDTIKGWGADFYALLPNLIVGCVVLLLFTIVAFIVNKAIRSYFTRNERIDLGNILAGFGFWGFVSLGVLIALTVIMPSLQPADLLASLGIGSLAVGFAFKDILQNWLAGLLILLRLPFRRGDQIKVGDAEGTVRRIEPRATIIRTYDGRDIVIPNTLIYTDKVTVHTSQPTRRTGIDITVGYDYNIRVITQIIQNALSPIKEILKDPEPQVLCWDLGSTSLGIKIRWWIDSERSDEVISRARAVQAIKEAFEANDIDPTDPQLVYYQSVDKPTSSTSSKKQKPIETSTETLVEGPPPPVFEMSADDPETFDPKLEDKKDTLLADK